MANSHPGGRRRSIEPAHVHEVLQNTDKRVMTTSDVADQLDATRPTVGKRLAELRDRGYADYVDVGSSKAWYLTSDSDADPTFTETEMNPLNRTYSGWLMVSGMSLGGALGAVWATVQPVVPLASLWFVLGIAAFVASHFASKNE